MKQYYLAATLLLAGTSAQAQVRLAIGPQAGYTLATAKYSYSSYTIDTRYRSGFAAGLLAEVGVGHLSVRPAALFAQKGINLLRTFNGVGVTTNDSRNRITYLIMPLNVGYTQHGDGQGLQVFGGAYFGFALGGDYTDYYSLTSNAGNQQQTISGNIVADDNSSTNSNDRRVRPGDFGVQGGLGYRYKGLLAQAEYSWGLRNVDPSNSSSSYSGNPVYYNRVFQFSLAYLFGPRT